MTDHHHGLLLCILSNPTPLVKPNRDIGKLLAFSPSQASLILQMFIDTEDAPPPKKRVTTRVAEFSANADGNNETTGMK